VNAAPGDSAAPADKGQPAAAEVPADLVDPAFADAVDLAAVRQAIGALDAKALMDHAETLLLAERKLGKKHKSLGFAALVELAIRIAADAQDAQALGHIAKSLERLGVKDFDQKLKAAANQERSRVISAGPNVPLSETTPEAIVLYNAMKKQVKLALLLGDRKALASMRQKIERLTELHQKQREHLLLLCTEAIAAMPMDSGVQTLSLQKLTGPLYSN
jgi:hypothetical protein